MGGPGARSGGGGGGAGNGEDSYLASVSDLMVGMLFVFIIMLMAFALNFRCAQENVSRTRAELEQARAAVAGERDELVRRNAAVTEVAERLLEQDRTRAALLEGLALDLGERAVPVVLDARNGVLRLPESLLFDSGSAALRPEGERALRELAATLAAALPCHSRAPPAAQARCGEGGARPLLEAVLIEGHTDDVPLRGGGGAGFGDNWQLSAARGVSTFKALTAAAPGLEELENTRGEALLGVAGYEARRPVAAGSAPETRRLNRRIDLRFLVAAPGEPELAGLRAAQVDAEGGGR